MKMKRHMMEKCIYQRPTPRELQKNHPGVYNSLSEEAKQANASSYIVSRSYSRTVVEESTSMNNE